MTITGTSFDGSGTALNTVVVEVTGTTPGTISTEINPVS